MTHLGHRSKAECSAKVLSKSFTWHQVETCQQDTIEEGFAGNVAECWWDFVGDGSARKINECKEFAVVTGMRA